jgi:hypothetical protein
MAEYSCGDSRRHSEGDSTMDKVSQPARRAWRVREFTEQLPISKCQIHAWVGDGTLPSAMIGGVRLILISPEQFVDQHRQEPGRG